MTGAEILDFEFVQVMVKGDHSMPFVHSGSLPVKIKSCEDLHFPLCYINTLQILVNVRLYWVLV